MSQPSSLFVVDSDVRSLETLTFGFEREGLSRAYAWRDGAFADSLAMARLRL